MRKEYDFRKAKRGPVVHLPKGKTRITIRLDDDVLEWFRGQVDRAGGGNYQSWINEVAAPTHIARAGAFGRHFAKSNPRRAAQSWMICRTVMRLHGLLAR